MIIASEISKVYRTTKKAFFFQKKEEKIINALNNVSLEIKPGVITGILGVNGAGKTTLIKILTGQISPSEGSITFNGQNITENIKKLKLKTNVITGTEKNLYWRLTAKENLEYFGSLYGIERSRLKNRIDEILRLVRLTEFKDIPVEQYSKGMKQRLQIARGLINEPEYIFLDEPTLGLDIVIAREIRDYVKKLSRESGIGVLLTSHYMSEVEYLCDYIYILNEGEVISQGTMEDIKKCYSINNKYKVTLSNNSMLGDMIENNLSNLGEIEINGNLLYLEGQGNDISSISRKLDEYKIEYEAIEKHKLTLEEVVLNIVKN